MKTVTIRKGKHHPFWWWVPRFCWDAKAIEVSVFVDPSMCSGSKAHINKVCGISRGWHHDNSVRLGWSNEGTQVRFWHYEYIEGIRREHTIGYGYPGQWVKFKLYLSKVTGPKLGFVLYPYHGGDADYERAVQNVIVRYRYKVI